MPAILLPSGKLLVAVEAANLENGFARRDIGSDHPGYGTWLAAAGPG
jgi:hypothetical protein